MEKNPDSLLALFANLFAQEFPLGFWTGDDPAPFDQTWTFHVDGEGDAFLRVALDDGTNHAEFEWTLNLRSQY